jgi:hypothetical protein
MGITGSAYFVERPRTMADLSVPHPFERERLYEVVKTVKLARIDYENFITDLLADRQFIEDHAALCGMARHGDAFWSAVRPRRRRTCPAG